MTELKVQLEHAEALIQTIKGSHVEGTDAHKQENVSLKEEVKQLKLELARCLKVQKTFEVQSREKDTQIQDLLDYKKLWFPEKFLKMEATIKELQGEKNTMKVTYELKQTMQIEKITAELSRESVSLKAELERTKDALRMREAELEPLY